MANARPSNPSRIGKTLGAILSVPRRGAADEIEEADTGEIDGPAVRGADEPGSVPNIEATLSLDGGQGRAVPTDLPATPAEASPSTRPLPAASAASTALVAVRPPGTGHGVAPEHAEIATNDTGSRRKKRETFLIPEELADAMRNAIVHLSGPPLYYTLAEFGEHAIRNYIAQLERDHNAGQPFPTRPRAVRQGRPLR